MVCGIDFLDFTFELPNSSGKNPQKSQLFFFICPYLNDSYIYSICTTLLCSAPAFVDQKPVRVPRSVPAVVPKTEEPIQAQPSDEVDFKPPSIAQAKMLFDQTGMPLPPPATLPKESVAPSTIPVYATAKTAQHVAAPKPSVPAAIPVGRGDSPPRFISSLLHMHVNVVSKKSISKYLINI